jgi:hypothetical protein
MAFAVAAVPEFPFHKLPELDNIPNLHINAFTSRMKTVSLKTVEYDPTNPGDRLIVTALLYKLRNVPSFAALLTVLEEDSKQAISDVHSESYMAWIEWLLNCAKMNVCDVGLPFIDSLNLMKMSE